MVWSLASLVLAAVAHPAGAQSGAAYPPSVASPSPAMTAGSQAPSAPRPVTPIPPQRPRSTAGQFATVGDRASQPGQAPATAGTATQPTNYQLPYVERPGRVGAGDEQTSVSPIRLEPPGLERLARLDTEETLQERIRQETREVDPTERITFPPEPILSHDTYNGRGPIWPHRQMVVEPNFLFHERLLFEQKNFERYGWDLGILSPIVGAATFYGDVAMLPYNLATCPCQRYDSSAGQCLPGDPVPFLLYPPEISVTGTLAETAAILALVAIFP